MRAAVGAVCLLLVAAGVVSAHASLVSSEPAQGEVVVTPATLTATFDEELDAVRSRLVVRNEAGEEVARGGVGTDPLVMTVALPELPPGPYAARWTAVTPDDQGVTRGTIEFTIEAPAPSPTPTARSSPALTVTPPAMATEMPTTAPPTPTAAAATPTAVAPLPTPSPADPAQETAGGDVLLALLVAGVLVGGLALYLLRR